MALKEKITEELKNAMKSGDKVRLETIRSVRALILEFEKSGSDMVISEEDEVRMITSAVKKRKESIEQFQKAGRTDLSEKEEKELAILMEFMPKQMDESEVLEYVKKIAAEIGAVSKADFPKLMPLVVKNLKGKAEGKMIKSAVEQVLS
ncbi:MAG: GatB/YqeY domain-containing protein [Ignavibacteriaceae bacterium]